MTMGELAGYRVLRPLGHGARSVVWLGVEPVDGAEPVALKAVDPLDPRFAVEAAAFERAAGDHVVKLLDLHIERDRAALVLERLGPATLDVLLTHRGALAEGEIVTVLAPVAATLARMHDRGVAHGAVHAAHVAFRRDGAPVLIGFGAAELFAPGLPEVVLEGVPAVRADREGMRALALGLLESARTAGATALAADLRAAESAAVLPGLSRRLFQLAPAAPVRLDAPAGASMVPVRAVAVGDPVISASEREVQEPQPERGAFGAWASALLPDGLLDRVLGDRMPRPRAPAEIAEGLRARWTALPVPRRRLLVAASAAGVTLLLVSGLLGEPGAPAAPAAPAATAAPATPAATAPDGAHTGGPHIAGPDDDDPVVAVLALLALRDGCLRDRDAACLDAVDEPGAAASDRDAALIGGPDAAPVAVLGAGEAWLVDRWGDSALVALPAGSDPEAVLLLRTDGGWRIRELYPAGAG